MHVDYKTMRALPFVVSSAIALSLASGAHADPKSDCIAAADQGQTMRDDGHYRVARQKFVACSQAACPKIVQTSCTQWLHDIEGAMPSLVLGAKDSSGGDLADVHVTFDGATLTDTLDGKPIEVDPGTHTLRFTREGSEPVAQKVIVRAGEKTRVVSVTMSPKIGTNAQAPQTGTSQPPAPEPEKPSTPSPYLGRNVLGASLLVLGAGGLALGVVFGVQSQSAATDADGLRTKLGSNAACTRGPSPDCTALSDAVDAQNRDATLSIATYVVGGVLVAGGVLAFLLWPKAKETPPVARVLPMFGTGTTGATLIGSF